MPEIPDIPMSNQDEQQQDAEFPDEEELAVEQIADEPPVLPAPEAPSRKGSGGIAWLALFLALVASAGAGYMALQDWRARGEADQNASALAELRNRIASSDESLSGLDGVLAEQAVQQFAVAYIALYKAVPGGIWQMFQVLQISVIGKRIQVDDLNSRFDF